MTRTRCISVRNSPAWLVALLLAIALGGCAQEVRDRITATGERQATAQATGNPGPVDAQEAALAYAQCIRASGYPEWPDPNSEGQFLITRDAGMSFDDPRRIAAMEACQELRPAGLGTPGAHDQETMEMLLELARCMRENGVPEFPDPTGGGRFVVGPGQGGFDPNSPTFQAALETCAGHVQGLMRGIAR